MDGSRRLDNRPKRRSLQARFQLNLFGSFDVWTGIQAAEIAKTQSSSSDTGTVFAGFSHVLWDALQVSWAALSYDENQVTRGRFRGHSLCVRKSHLDHAVPSAGHPVSFTSYSPARPITPLEVNSPTSNQTQMNRPHHDTRDASVSLLPA